MTVDASVFVSSLHPPDAYYSMSRQFTEQIRTEDWVVICPTLVVIECAGAIGRLTGREADGRDAITAVRSFRSLRFVPLSEELSDAAAELAAVHQLRGADAVYVAVAREFGTTLVTWDREMLTRSPAAVTTINPGDWLAAHSAAR